MEQWRLEWKSVMIPVCELCTTCMFSSVCRPEVSVCYFLMASLCTMGMFRLFFSHIAKKKKKDAEEVEEMKDTEGERDEGRCAGGAEKILLGALEDLPLLHLRPRDLRETRLLHSCSKDL